MGLDIRTLTIVTVAFALVCFLALLAIYTIYPKNKGLLVFTSGFLGFAIGFLLIGFRADIPLFLSVIIGNISIGLGTVVMGKGALQFLKSEFIFFRCSMVILILVACLLFYFLYVEPSVNARIVSVSFGLAAILAICAMLMLTVESDVKVAQRVTVIPLVVVSLFFFIRGVLTIAEEEKLGFMQSGTLHQLSFFFFIFLMIFSILGMFLMTTSRLENRLKRKSLKDSLTGLYNRFAIDELVEKEVARCKRHNTSLSIVLLDLDHFKSINDEFGHTVGDAVLHNLGKVLNKCVRGTDIAIRYGGEEFLVVLPETDTSGALQFAAKIRKHLKDIPMSKNPRLFVTASIGIAEFKADESFDQAVHEADSALYRSKENGRDTITLWDELIAEAW